jgi:hypothetical protein
MTTGIHAANSATGRQKSSVEMGQPQASPTAIFGKASSIVLVDQSENGRVRYTSAQSVDSIFSEGAVSPRPVNAGSSPARTARRQVSVDAITGRQAIRDRVAEEFVLKLHMPAIEKACRLGHFMVSIRNTGKASLDKLKLGAPAKGHNILEKTIKEGSICKNYPPQQAEALMNAMKNADLLGYVGHWDKITGALLGVYVAPNHQLGDRVVGGIYKFDLQFLEGTDRIDIERLHASLAALKEQGNWQAKIFTGDYDMHDMIDLHGRRGTVPSDSPQERRIISRLNKEIVDADKQLLGMPPEYNRLRHGSQDSYLGNTLAKKEPVVPEVAKTSFPVAFCYNGEWTIVENTEEHLAFYRENDINMKNTWNPEASDEQGKLKIKVVQRQNRPNIAGVRRKLQAVANFAAKS